MVQHITASDKNGEGRECKMGLCGRGLVLPPPATPRSATGTE